jgi:hypothetical protein
MPLWSRILGASGAVLFCITGFVVAMRVLGWDVVALAIHHDWGDGGGGVPVLEGLVRVAPWWLLLASVAAGASARSVDEGNLFGGLSTVGTVMLLLSVPYLAIKLLTDIAGSMCSGEDLRVEPAPGGKGDAGRDLRRLRGPGDPPGGMRG